CRLALDIALRVARGRPDVAAGNKRAELLVVVARGDAIALALIRTIMRSVVGLHAQMTSIPGAIRAQGPCRALARAGGERSGPTGEPAATRTTVQRPAQLTAMTVQRETPASDCWPASRSCLARRSPAVARRPRDRRGRARPSEDLSRAASGR